LLTVGEDLMADVAVYLRPSIGRTGMAEATSLGGACQCRC